MFQILPVIGALILFGLLYWAVVRLMQAFGIGEPVAGVVIVILVVVVVLWLVSVAFGPHVLGDMRLWR